MQYFIAFLEGIITFISPCLLPMLPIYVSYFTGGDKNSNRARTLKNALGFVLGFTVVFVLLGALAGTLGGFLTRYKVAVNVITGVIVIIFGLSYTGLFKITLFKGFSGSVKTDELKFFTSVLFGITFSIGWTPCVGAFLGSALMLASQQGKVLVGVIMLLCYSIGLGIPFVAGALLIDNLKGAFAFIKRHYAVINLICGIMLISLGILMATGLLGRALTILS